jgi:hypothetical protein
MLQHVLRSARHYVRILVRLPGRLFFPHPFNVMGLASVRACVRVRMRVRVCARAY